MKKYIVTTFDITDGVYYPKNPIVCDSRDEAETKVEELYEKEVAEAEDLDMTYKGNLVHYNGGVASIIYNEGLNFVYWHISEVEI